MATTKKPTITNTEIAVGAGLALAAAAAGAYFLYGKDAPKRRAQVRGWMLKAKGEVLEQLEKLPNLDESTYYGLIDTVSSKYAGLKNVDSAEMMALVKELRGGWKNIKKQLTPVKAAKKAAPKKASKTVKKSAKKATKKASKNS